MQYKNISRILIRSANWVGDAIMSTPAIRAIRKNFPAAHIGILAKPWVSPLYENNPDIDEILIYDAAGRHKGLMGKWRLSNDLKAFQFDLAILLQNAFEAALLAFLAKIPNRMGYAADGRSALLTHRIHRPHDYKRIHQIDYYLGILKRAGFETFGREQTLIISETERKNAEAILNFYGADNKELLIGINPGAAYGTAKRWFPDRYAELCRRIEEQVDAKFIVFGGPGEESLGEHICDQVGKNCINLCGKTNLRQAFALIETCRLFITNDSGLMHAAAALNIPQLAIFGSTNYTTTSPAGDKSTIIRIPTPCSPCLKPDCPTDHRCMTAVTVDMVYEKFRDINLLLVTR
jgi:heptosyltransferase-2